MRLGPYTACAGAAMLLFACGDSEGGGARAVQRDGPPANFLLVSIDTCRADALGCYGHGAANTPNLDELARQGTRFANALAPVPITLPSHSTMLTGTNPPHHGVRDNTDYRLTESTVTMAEIAGAHGYATGAVVAAFVLDSRFGLDRGFDAYDDDFGAGEGSIGISERNAAGVSDAAITWLDEHRAEPFFLFLHYYDPHQAYDPPAPFRPASDDPRALYDGEIAYTDHNVGRVLTRLKELELFDSTLVVVTSDHGEMHGEHGERTHSFFVYEAALRVPLIVKLPAGVAGAGRQGQVIEERVGLVDVVPTACAVLGLPLPETVHGTDLSPALGGAGAPPAERVLYFESLTPTKYDASPLLGIASGRWKYIHTARPELYDVEADPGETRDRAGEDAARAGALRERLGRLFEEQARAAGEARVAAGAEAQEKIQALGYTGASVSENFDLDDLAAGADPKDIVEFANSDGVLGVLIHEERFDEARALGGRMLRDRPESISVRFHMARIAVESGPAEEALQHMEAVLELSPAHPRAHFVCGRAYEWLGRLDLAEESYRSSLAGNPSDPAAHNQLGGVLLLGGEMGPAMVHLREALSIDPVLTAAHVNLGKALLATGETEAGTNHLLEALRIDPCAALAHERLGALREEQGNADEALRYYTEAVRCDAGRVRAHVGLARLYGARGELDQTILYARKALELDPNSSPAATQLGIALRVAGDAEGAVEWLERSLEADPQNVQSMFMLTDLLATNTNETVRDAQRAVELGERAAEQTGRRDARILDALASAYATSGEFDRAVEVATEAATLADAAGAGGAAQRIRAKLELYRRGEPFRSER